jgi:DNA-binding transcriptional ArsR family regulator
MREVEKALYWILAGTMGGANRVRILNELIKKPQNTNNLSKVLDLDFKTVQYHLKVLEKNGFVTFKGGGGFSRLYFPSQIVEDNVETLHKIIQQMENELNSNKKEGKK